MWGVVVGDGSLLPCARGRAREGDAWQAGPAAAPVPTAPGMEEEEAVLESGPFDTTTHIHTHTHKMDQWPIRCRMRGARSDRGERIYILNICPNN